MPEEVSTNPNLPIQKKVLHSGRGEIPQFPDGTKVKHLYLNYFLCLFVRSFFKKYQNMKVNHLSVTHT